MPGHVLGEPRAVRSPGEEDQPGPGRALPLEVRAELREEARVVKLLLAGWGPQRVPEALPAIGEHRGDAGRGPAPGEPGEPRYAAPVHPGPVQHDQQRRARLLPGQPRRAGDPVAAPYPRDLDR